MGDYMIDLIKAVDSYDSVIGYELLNEPHIWAGPTSATRDEDYISLGEFHTYMVNRFRATNPQTGQPYTTKVIVFTRETAHPGGGGPGAYGRDPNLEINVIPRDPLKNMWYWPHLYAMPGTGGANSQLSSLEDNVDYWRDNGICPDPNDINLGTAQPTCPSSERIKYDVKMGIGEWATQDNQICKSDLDSKGQQIMDAFVCRWAQEGWAHTYWSWGCFGCAEGNALLLGPPNYQLTPYGTRYAVSIGKYYSPSWNGQCPTPPSLKPLVDEDPQQKGVQC
jgi:hypothetical protein